MEINILDLVSMVKEAGAWEDFEAFSARIDEVKEKYGFDEDEAIKFVMETWDFPLFKKEQ